MQYSIAEFPHLASEGYTEKSPVTPKYNCIAWAAGDDARCWWPTMFGYWPSGVPRANSIEAFVQAFVSLGYEECDDNERFKPQYEDGYVRVAIYVANGVPKHAARQVNAETWTSKIGQNADIEHTLRGLEGPLYGAVKKILRRSVPVAP